MNTSPATLAAPAPAVPAPALPDVQGSPPIATDPQPQNVPGPDADPVSHDPVPQSEYGSNTPTKRSSSSGVWQSVKRLKGELNNDRKDATHICLVRLGGSQATDHRFCNALLKLNKTPANKFGTTSWISTRACDHLREEHPIDSPEGAKFALKMKQREGNTMGMQMQYGMPAPNGSDMLGAESLTSFKLSKTEKSLSAQAQWYVYSSMQISKSEFESIWFKRMLKEVGDGELTAILNAEKLKKFVKAEFDVFLLFLKLIVTVNGEGGGGQGECLRSRTP